MKRFDIPRDDLAGSRWLYYFVLCELARHAGGFPVANVPGVDGVRGGEGALGVRIRRHAADPAALAHVRKTGALAGGAPVPDVLQPNAIDPIVLVRFSSGDLAFAAQAGRGEQVRALQPVGEGHCRFPAATIVTALDALRMR